MSPTEFNPKYHVVKKKLSKFKQKLFSCIIRTHFAEMEISQLTFKFFLYTYLAIVTTGIIDGHIKEWYFKLVLVDFVQRFKWFAFIYTFIVFIIKVKVISETNDGFQLSFPTRSCVYLSIVFTYIVYPMTIVTFFEYICHSAEIDHVDLSILNVSIFMIIILLGLMNSLLYLKIRCKFYCKSYFSTIDSKPEILSYVATLIMLALSRASKQKGIGSNPELSLQISANILNFLSLSYCIVQPSFWHLSSRSHFVAIRMMICWIQLYVDICNGQVEPRKLFILIIALLLTLRISKYFFTSSYKINIFESKTSNLSFNMGLNYLDRFTRMTSDEISKFSKIEQDMYVFYTGIWTKNAPKLLKEIDRANNCKDIFCNSCRQKALLALTKKRSQTSLTTLHLMFLLQLSSLMAYLKVMRQLYTQLIRFNSSSFFGSLDYYYLRKMLECKLNALYKGEINDNELVAVPLYNLLDQMSYHSSIANYRESSSEYVDCLKPLRYIKDFKGFSSQFDNLLKNSLTVFESLEENTVKTSKALFSMNKKTLKSKAETQKVANDLLKKHLEVGIATFVYPSLIFYYSLVKYNIKKAEYFLFLYRRKLLSLINKSERKNIFHDAAIELSSVAILSSMEKESLGKISNITINYFEYLGEPKNGSSPVGMNINELLPDYASKAHLSAMMTLESHNKLNSHSEMFINNFKGHLIEAQAVVKVLPLLKSCLSTATLVHLNQNSSSCNILVDKNCNIISADSKFWNIIEATEIEMKEDQPLTIGMFSSGLSMSLSITHLLGLRSDTKFKEEPTSFEDISLDPSKAFKNSFRFIIENNSAGGLFYSIDPESPMCKLMDDPNFIAVFKDFKIFDDSMILISMQFNMSSRKVINMMKKKTKRGKNLQNDDDSEADNRSEASSNSQRLSKNKRSENTSANDIISMRNDRDHFSNNTVRKFDEILIELSGVLDSYFKKTFGLGLLSNSFELTLNEIPEDKISQIPPATQKVLKMLTDWGLKEGINRLLEKPKQVESIMEVVKGRSESRKRTRQELRPAVEKVIEVDGNENGEFKYESPKLPKTAMIEPTQEREFKFEIREIDENSVDNEDQRNKKDGSVKSLRNKMTLTPVDVNQSQEQHKGNKLKKSGKNALIAVKASKKMEIKRRKMKAEEWEEMYMNSEGDQASILGHKVVQPGLPPNPMIKVSSSNLISRILNKVMVE